MSTEPLKSLTFPGPHGAWQTDLIEPGLVHVRPVADLIDHPADEDCACGPRAEACFNDDGSNGWMYVHDSLDGRERFE